MSEMKRTAEEIKEGMDRAREVLVSGDDVEVAAYLLEEPVEDVRRVVPGKKGRRARRSGFGGQAMLETAMVLPILLAIIFNVLAMMIQVRYQQQFDSAVSLAASSTLDAPLGAGATSRAYATQSFNGTLQPPSWITVDQPVTCNGPYLNGAIVGSGGNSGVTCTAHAVIHFNQTALGLAVPWNPSLSATAIVFPSPARQCQRVVSQNQTTC
jgi:hypothetical protein